MRVLAALVAASAAGVAAAAPAADPPRPDHIVLVIEENKPYGAIVGNAAAPFLNELAAQGALFTNSYAVAHPSQPNYLALFSGSTQDVHDDRCPLDFGGPNLADALERRGARFAVYAESLPAAGDRSCFGAAYRYARKHNPVADWPQLGASTHINRPFDDFPADFRGLPALALVVPNLTDDMHDGPSPAAQVAQGDAWLRRNLSAYAQWARQHNSLLIVTWDEDDGSDNNHVATLIVGAGVAPGRYAQRITHYDVLRTIGDLLGLPPLGNAASASGVGSIWQAPARAPGAGAVRH